LLAFAITLAVEAINSRIYPLPPGTDLADLASMKAAIGVLLLAAAVANMLVFPHPAWFRVIGVAVYPVGTWLGARMGGTPIKSAG
jgi:hypothetical protein